MEKVNQSNFRDFLLQGFSDLEQFRIHLFFIFLTIYLFTIIENLVIVLVVRFNATLHTPMYFFITVLSFLEMWYVTTTVPKLLSILVTNDKRISFRWCFAQLYMFHSLGITECSMLAVMAFDRCMAIYIPLRYNTIMTGRVCKLLVLFSWSYGFLVAIMPVTFTIRAPYCGPHDIMYYFCDLAPLTSIACGDTTPINTANQLVSAAATFFILMFVIVMYLIIIYSIIKIKTNKGRSKAFSTCSSHLVVVVLFYSTAFIVYIVPKNAHSVEHDKIYAIIYTMLTPLLNPIIYCLRNNNVKEAMKQSIHKIQEHIKGT
ncbi:olfactory receptor 6N1-like [Pelobates cultripes]|uniref:Olfactory receptor n=1 Tax=Pelobates cultripes TaxID=61616 RepID=A0AAD1TKW7_PELCU|nr:olfactory receptor 6N1-like [Pelobates cultripes]